MPRNIPTNLRCSSIGRQTSDELQESSQSIGWVQSILELACPCNGYRASPSGHCQNPTNSMRSRRGRFKLVWSGMPWITLPLAMGTYKIFEKRRQVRRTCWISVYKSDIGKLGMVPDLFCTFLHLLFIFKAVFPIFISFARVVAPRRNDLNTLNFFSNSKSPLNNLWLPVSHFNKNVP